MKQKNLQQGLKEAICDFQIPGTFQDYQVCGNGHINDTYLVTFLEEGSPESYCFQHMNRTVFRNPEALMENIIHVTDFLKDKIEAQGGDSRRETLNFVLSSEGNPYYIDSTGEYWRAYHYIDHVFTLDAISKPEDFYHSALAFGNFQYMLSDFPAESLHEVIHGFHDTKARFEVFKKAVEKDLCGRADSAREEIRFILERENVANILGNLQENGTLPLRVTHNDTKSNNILMDEDTGKGLCVIDLDTVMPGLAVNDFGDSIRFGANTGSEDEKDLTKVSCDLTLYDVYTKGFVEGCNGSLTEDEIRSLPLGAKVMTFECGMRFLTDYLCGDTYFKTEYPEHNLVRSRTQLKLVADMEQKWDELLSITEKYL